MLTSKISHLPRQLGYPKKPGAHRLQRGLPEYPEAQVSHLAPTNFSDLQIQEPFTSQLRSTDPSALHEQSRQIKIKVLE